MINIAVPGVNGRMGQAIAQQVLQAQDLCLAVATVRAAEQIGQKVANSDVITSTSFADTDFDVMIDFTLPAGAMEHVEYCRLHGKAMVIGTTGLSAEQVQIIQTAAQEIPILMSSNMSIGVNICYKLLANASKMLDKDWQMAITDIHHQHKKDMPSGTAKQMAKVLAENSGRNLTEIAIVSERRGEVIGEHTVTFTNPLEQIQLSHIAQDRSIFAQGAVSAARWVYKRAPGLYSMADLISD